MASGLHGSCHRFITPRKRCFAVQSLIVAQAGLSSEMLLPRARKRCYYRRIPPKPAAGSCVGGRGWLRPSEGGDQKHLGKQAWKGEKGPLSLKAKGGWRRWGPGTKSKWTERWRARQGKTEAWAEKGELNAWIKKVLHKHLLWGPEKGCLGILE